MDLTNFLQTLGPRLLAALVLGTSACAPVTTPPASAPATRPIATVPAGGTAGEFDLSVANIMRGELLVGRSPSEVRWSDDSRHLYFRWREPGSGDTTTSIYRVAAEGGAPERLADSVAHRVTPASPGRWSADANRRAFERAGDIFVSDRTGREWRITETPGRERSPHLSPDGQTVYFLSGNNVYAIALNGGPLRQLTDIRLEARPAERSRQERERLLREQQTELFGAVRDRAEEQRHRAAADSARLAVRPTYTGDRTSLVGAEVSPSGGYVLISVSERVEATQTIVPNFVTEGGYTEDLVVRSKVGDAQAGQRTGILDLSTGEITWIDAGFGDRRMSMMPVGWAPRTDRALVIGLASDYKDRWIFRVGSEASVQVIDHLRDDAWIGGPGVFTVGWLPGGDRAYFISERTGWAHLYTVPAAGGRATPLTTGSWEVRNLQLASDGSRFYLTTSEVHPGEQHLYSVPVGGGERTRLTNLAGWSDALVSPDGRWLANLHSLPNQPPELFLSAVANNSQPRRLTESTTAEFQRGPWIQPEIFSFPASDDVPVYARIYRPSDLGAQPNGAAVLFVHGAGYLQNAHRGWSSYYREYMFHHLLAQRGYTVLDIDYRASAGYGRDVRTGIYRHMGGKDLSDHVDAVNHLVRNEGIDSARVGIYGGSYGGFITLMALFNEPDVFRSGAALRSVTDWAHYNHPYTSRILNQPQDDPVAYRQSSPIYFAEGLRGDLLITHGMVDTNVHFQDVVRLTQRLIELGKTNWEMAVYPVEDHAFVRADSWTDQYRRILELFERTLQ
ncbi:prolyl oligopeptidase family serine peptidase [soil metagenome]